MTEDVRLTLAEGVPLVHAMVARIARDHDIKALLIKGPILEMQGLREPRESGDVDVLCDPAGVTALVDELTRLGWTVFNEHPVKPLVLERYGLAYFHERWPCGIDLHHRFPGFFAPPEVVFATLWSRRELVELAAQPVDCTDLLGSAMIHGLHLLRGRSLALTDSDLDHLADTLQRLDGSAKLELAELASVTGAADTLAAVLDRAGVPSVGRGRLSPADQEEWNLRVTASETKGLMWIEELRNARPRHWPGIVWRALTFDGRALYEGRLDEQRSMHATARIVIHRLRDAVRHLPRALSALIRLRRTR